MKRKWVVVHRQHDDLIKHLLSLRNYGNANIFLNPQYDDRHDPALLPNLLIAVERLRYAVDHQQTIGLYGDYDCDGIPGTALLARILAILGADVKVHIPRREAGYGLSQSGIDQLKSQNINLMIAIDNGTTAITEVAYALSLNIDVIIIDHHEPHAELPTAIIVNPKLVGSQYPTNDLCGTGVVYKLVEDLSKHYPNLLDERVLKWQLDLVALATICDMVELVDENRIFATFGLKVLRQTKNVGLRALFEVAGIDPMSLTAGTVGFGLGPRINAAGRMDEDPLLGFRLLTTSDPIEALNIAQKLHRLNSERQDVLNEALYNAELQLNDEAQNSAIVLQNITWSPGIVGLIASKLLERYHKPTFIFDAKSGRGSARSIRDYSLPSAMEHLSKHFLSYGGHALAGGMRLKKDAFLDFKRDLNDHTKLVLGSVERKQPLYIDAEIALTEVSVDIAKRLNSFEPFGIGNPKPVFAVRGLTTRDIKVMGSDAKHLRGTLSQSKVTVPFVGFGFADRKDELLRASIDVAGRLELNHWHGRTTAELHLVDVQEGKF